MPHIHSHQLSEFENVWFINSMPEHVGLIRVIDKDTLLYQPFQFRLDLFNEKGVYCFNQNGRLKYGVIYRRSEKDIPGTDYYLLEIDPNGSLKRFKKSIDHLKKIAGFHGKPLSSVQLSSDSIDLLSTCKRSSRKRLFLALTKNGCVPKLASTN